MSRKARTGSDEKYHSILGGISNVIDTARRSAARSVNSIMTAAYWLIGRQIVESEQGGVERAAYGRELIARLSHDLTSRYGRGFRKSNLFEMRAFYLAYTDIFQTVSGKSAIPSRKSDLIDLASAFPLSWSHYVLLLRRSRSDEARRFYETEALRSGWSVRQLDRHLEVFLLELGGEFCFIGRQKRLRIGDEWYRVDTETLGPQGRKPARGADPVRPEERGRRPVRAGRASQQGNGLGVPDGVAR